ncbi:hypothetical protein H4W33_006514 [Kibdelosporangium phytohabitans]|uniref:Uncharacterized protein n=1 Tax=Kibdelosporangium phytohabitans TaxID=860235 RepID=A0A0N9HJW1_9PSEU|nr:hypothetical protein AOZ06_04970 [Kibdelosporangium phytohabitans]MBE1467502.1 hypothetical protein [Kibdelosporangium phytohabitans]
MAITVVVADDRSESCVSSAQNTASQCSLPELNQSDRSEYQARFIAQVARLFTKLEVDLPRC